MKSTRKLIDANAGVLEMVIETRARDLVEGFKVRRALLSRQRRMVGPFIFLDQMGPEVLRVAQGLDVAGSTRLMLLGSEPLAGKRHIWWNFVSCSRDVEQAKEDWREGRFAAVPEETEFIPESSPAVVRYP